MFDCCFTLSLQMVRILNENNKRVMNFWWQILFFWSNWFESKIDDEAFGETCLSYDRNLVKIACNVERKQKMKNVYWRQMAFNEAEP